MTKSADDIQIGGNQYKKWKVQPYKMMIVMNGIQGHILSYLLRTKGEDDIQKAMHYCDLALEDMQYIQDNIPDKVNMRIRLIIDWMDINGIHNVDDRELLMEIARESYAKAKIRMGTRLKHNRLGVSPDNPR